MMRAMITYWADAQLAGMFRLLSQIHPDAKERRHFATLAEVYEILLVRMIASE